MYMKKKIAIFATLLTVTISSMAQSVEVSRDNEIFAIKGKDTLKIDAYYAPKLQVKPEGRPVMVYIHGGGFVGGERKNVAQEIFCRYLAERGWLAVSVDYRLAGVRKNPDGTIYNPYHVDGTVSAVRIACEDVVAATNYILGHKAWKANPKQVTLGGGSAGAITTLQLIYDAANDVAYTRKLPKGFAYAGGISQAGCICTPVSEDTLVWKRKPCPIMFFHGDKDILVPLDIINASWGDCKLFGTNYIARQMKSMGLPYWKWIEKDADHVLAMKPLTNYLEEQYRFLNDFCLKGLKSTVNTVVEDKEPGAMGTVDLMLKYVPMYLLGYGKYMEEMDWNHISKPTEIKY